MSLETYLEDLTQEDIPLKYGEFLELSSLDSDDMELIQEVWPRFSPERRLDLVSRLVETSEENIDMDFTPIFKLALKDEAKFVRCTDRLSATHASSRQDREHSVVVMVTTKCTSAAAKTVVHR